MIFREQDLIERARNGERQAFDDLARPLRQRLLWLCWEYLNDMDDAQDAVQQAFLHAFEALNGYRGDAEFFSWLWSIALNVCKNKLRSRKATLHQNTLSLDATENQRLADHPDPGPSVTDQVIGPNQPIWEAIMAKAEGKWTKLDYDLFFLLYGEGKTYEEIASILHTPSGTLRSRKHARIQPVFDAVRRDYRKG